MRLPNLSTTYLLPSYLLRLANRHLIGCVENWQAPKSSEPLSHAPVFIVGAPRCGSTLLIQALTVALKLGYLSNFHCRWFGAPAFAESCRGATDLAPDRKYTSYHGQTTGRLAPAECGEWWYRFFRRKPAYVTAQEVDETSMLAFRRSIGSLTRVFQRPVVFKNLYASLRIQAIAKYVPESLFVILRRNEVDNGISLLKARHDRYGDYSAWFSLEPPGAEGIRSLPPHQQVIEQIRLTYLAIEKDLTLAGVGRDRCLQLTYENFCSDPEATVQTVQSFLERHGMDVFRKESLPAKFERRRDSTIPAELYAALIEYSTR